MSKTHSSLNNRAARRAAARSAKNGKPQVHATRSFEQLVGAANREALKPYIEHEVTEVANRMAGRLFKQMEPTQTRVLALEKLLQTKLGVSDAEIETAVADVEDDATGLVASTETTAAGDTVRATVRTKAKTAETFGEETHRMMFENLGKAPFTISERFETQLLGRKTGDVIEIELGEGDGAVIAEVTLDRVSTPKNKPAPEMLATQE